MRDQSPLSEQGLESAKALAVAGRVDEAQAVAQDVVAREPNNAEAYNFLGALQAQRGNASHALTYYERALALAPSLAKARSNLAAALLALGRNDDAERHLARACSDDPSHAPAFANLGHLRLRQGRADDALSMFERAATIAPDEAMNWSNLAAAQVQCGRELAAVASLRRALTLAPHSVSAWTNLANVFDRLDRPADMLDAIERALVLAPQSPELHTAAGVALRKLGRYDAAVGAHERALALRPDMARARFNRALILLARGQFAEGWRDYQSRQSALQSGLRVEPLSRDLSGRRILLIANQGLGDELFFLRFAPELVRRGAWVAYRASGKIAALLQRSGTLDLVTTGDDRPSDVDMDLLVDDLPYAIGADERTIPAPLPLSPLPDRATAMRNRLAAFGPPPYIGLTWRAGVDALGQLYKTVPVESLAGAVAGAPGSLVSLQRHPKPGETAAFAAAAGRPVHDFSAVNDDLEDALALLALLDEYVGVSNTNIHLRASLGRASRVLVPFPPEYRWMIQGDESPWFPGVRVYRQSAERDWRPALSALSAELRAR